MPSPPNFGSVRPGIVLDRPPGGMVDVLPFVARTAFRPAALTVFDLLPDSMCAAQHVRIAEIQCRRFCPGLSLVSLIERFPALLITIGIWIDSAFRDVAFL